MSSLSLCVYVWYLTSLPRSFFHGLKLFGFCRLVASCKVSSFFHLKFFVRRERERARHVSVCRFCVRPNMLRLIDQDQLLFTILLSLSGNCCLLKQNTGTFRLIDPDIVCYNFWWTTFVVQIHDKPLSFDTKGWAQIFFWRRINQSCYVNNFLKFFSFFLFQQTVFCRAIDVEKRRHGTWCLAAFCEIELPFVCMQFNRPMLTSDLITLLIRRQIHISCEHSHQTSFALPFIVCHQTIFVFYTTDRRRIPFKFEDKSQLMFRACLNDALQ